MGSVFYQVSGLVARPLLAGMFRLSSTGKKNVPKKGAAILASNHLSYIDSFLIPVPIWRPVTWISKAEHFDVPVQRFLFKQWNVIPMRRGTGDMEAFEQSVEVLREGKLLGIHPEGTRSTDGKLHRGRTGAVRMAIRAGCPIVPIGLVGTDKALPKGSSKPRFVKVQLHYGKPIDYAAYAGRADDRELVRKLTEDLMLAIRDLSGQELADDFHQDPSRKAPREGDRA
ncbi:MAG TPA: lysophospholipid acyltransferase family protein [Candidatus Thermoplasmatota archaeon]|nr:lysophospholipid acyltransferase family protein [Candidatus Thermoplasmatota archaeon]